MRNMDKKGMKGGRKEQNFLKQDITHDNKMSTKINKRKKAE